jgi:hypothetical protein
VALYRRWDSSKGVLGNQTLGWQPCNVARLLSNSIKLRLYIAKAMQ